MKFRLKFIDGVGWWPQVRAWWFMWHKIAEHNGSFGLYPESDRDYPKTREEALEIIHRYKQNEAQAGKVAEYFDV